MTKITTINLENAYSYQEYIKLATNLFEQNKTTSDDPHYNEAWLLELTKLNFQRIHRLEKTTIINPELIEKLKNLKESQYWVILVESWCGDVAQNLPVLEKMAELSEGKVEIKLLVRDKNPEIMNMYLTNGGKSIPKLISVNTHSLEEIFTWGPRPAPVQELMLENKKQNLNFEKGHEIIHGWYAKDKTQTLQKEIFDLIR